ncbi:thiamine biosynthesis lipoprotein ApbE [Idiomarina xiamenensis 10-D-4]|uniref:FAD:protein FMN transferase n=2 Tax=Idiomarina xiamenensis TaxID=1207041 RepID=K2KN33_9GAMM|nr:thiamine biosynthesis lipoprotein ApbE [Idiomarina xiamenensis 10-D-4]
MGTTYHVRFVSANPEHSASDIQATIDRVLERVNAQMSTYDPDSELSKFNQLRSSEPVVISRGLELVVARALEIAEDTGGVLDVTVGPLVNMWGFGPDARPEHSPSEAEIARIRAKTGYHHLAVENHQLIKQEPELYVDLSTIAKGYGVDRVAEVLEQLGINNYLVEIGGEMRLKGRKPGNEPWRIAIEKPVSSDRAIQRVLEPGDNAVATSGDYRNFYIEDGRRYSHVIDPRTGYPINHHLVSATVFAKDCMTADGYSTALLVMGTEEALAFAEAHDIPALLIAREGDEFKEYTSTAFKPYMQ